MLEGEMNFPSSARYGEIITIGNVRFRCTKGGDPAKWSVLAKSAEDKPVAVLTLTEARAKALKDVAGIAAIWRAEVATPGKELVYVQKQNEAVACLDDPAPSSPGQHPVTGNAIDNYPNLRAMIGVWVPRTGNIDNDLRSAATFVLGKRADAKRVMAAIETLTDQAKAQINAATTTEQINAIVASLELPA